MFRRVEENVVARRERRRLEVVELRRAEILQAAGQLFQGRGYHRTTISDIAETIGMGHSAFYRYFKNKRDILDVLVDQLMADVFAALGFEHAPEAASSLAEYRSQVHAIVGRLWEVLDRSPVMHVVVFQADAVDETFAERVTLAYETAVTVISGYLENGVERGFLRPELETTASARVMLGVILGGLADRRAGQARAAQRGFTDAAIGLVFDGLAGAHATSEPRRVRRAEWHGASSGTGR